MVVEHPVYIKPSFPLKPRQSHCQISSYCTELHHSRHTTPSHSSSRQKEGNQATEEAPKGKRMSRRPITHTRGKIAICHSESDSSRPGMLQFNRTDHNYSIQRREKGDGLPKSRPDCESRLILNGSYISKFIIAHIILTCAGHIQTIT